LDEIWCHDITNGKHYLIDTDTDNAGSRELTVRSEGDAITNSGSAKLRFYFGWFTSSGEHYIFYKIDNHYISLGSEMYTYLGIPDNDNGFFMSTDSFVPNYLYSAWNGSRLMITGRPRRLHTGSLYYDVYEENIGYYSIANNPDIIPVLNIVRFKYPPTGITNIGQDFIIFSKRHAELIRIVTDGDAYQEDEFLDRGLVNQKALVKISDDLVAGFDYKGPWILSNRNFRDIGTLLREWWDDKLSDTVKDGCIAGYNHLKEQLWFSFPDYTDSDYPNGIIFVYDMRAERLGISNPWWILKSDIPLKDFTINQDLHLLSTNGESTSKIVDFNQAGTDENVETNLKIKMIQNPLIGRKMQIDKVRVRYSGDDDITVKMYYDESSSPDTTVNVNSDKNTFVRQICKTFELELESAESTNDLDYREIQVTYKNKRI